MIENKKAEEAKEKYTMVAYGAYLNGACPKKSFKDYLQMLGITGNTKVDKEELQAEIAHAKEVIKKMDAARNK